MSTKRWIAYLIGTALVAGLPGWLILAFADRASAPWSTERVLTSLGPPLGWIVVTMTLAARSARAATGAVPTVGFTVIALLGLLGHFSSLYWQVAVDPRAFDLDIATRVDAIYFALTTLTTTGFGDIAPITQAARVAVSAQLLASLVIVVGLGSVVVSRLSARPSRPPFTKAK